MPIVELILIPCTCKDNSVQSGTAFKPRSVSFEEFSQNWDIAFGASGKAN